VLSPHLYWVYTVVELQHNLWGGPKIWRAIVSQENFSEAPRPLQKSHFGDQNVFILQFQHTQKTLVNCNKASIHDGWSSRTFRGPFTGPLEPSQNRCFVRPPDLSSGPGPLGPYRNSTTEYTSQNGLDLGLGLEMLGLEKSLA